MPPPANVSSLTKVTANVRPLTEAVGPAGVPLDLGTWGPLANAFEDNSARQVARSAYQQIQLHPATALNRNTATIAWLYSVHVNDIPVSVVQAAITQQNPRETTLLLTLPVGTFKAGDPVTVAWEQLENAQGQPLSGVVNLVAE